MHFLKRRFVAFSPDDPGTPPVPPGAPTPPSPSEPTAKEIALAKEIAELREKIKKGEIAGMSESTAHALLDRLNKLEAKLDAAEKAEVKKGFRLFF